MDMETAAVYLVRASVISGFEQQGRFYTREEAAEALAADEVLDA